ncbi:Metallo-dependent phosphatase [Fomes fomentarius]|nr:Metallo-dependent phosphatase [Fomes fomentarius]
MTVPQPSLETPTAVVYDSRSYDKKHPPRHPGVGWTRFVCISDNHSHVFPVPPGDVLLHSGDLSAHGTLRDLEVTLDWLKTLPHPVKLFIAGNHDLALDAKFGEGGSLRQYRPRGLGDRDVPTARELIRSNALREAGMYYLEYESVVNTSHSGKTYTIYGSPATPNYKRRMGAFRYNSGDGKAIYDRIPASTTILMTHGPPLGICDTTRHGDHGGCPELAERLKDDDLKSCRLHVFGHFHDSPGVALGGQTPDDPSGRISVNAALPNSLLPVIVDLKD